MSAEKELQEWLNRPEKTFAENLKFAIKVFSALEFSLQNKYEAILDWFSKALLDSRGSNVDISLVSEMVQLRFPQNLVSITTKKTTVSNVRKYVSGAADELKILKQIDLLVATAGNPSYQAFYRNNVKSYLKLQHTILSKYVDYFELKTDTCPSGEALSFAKVIANIKNYVVHQSNVAGAFGDELLDILMTASLFLNSEKKFYTDVMEILNSIYFDKRRLNTFLKSSLHVQLPASLHCLDFAINHFRAEQSNIRYIIQIVMTDESSYKERLCRSAHLLNLLHKYDIDINFEVIAQQTVSQLIATYVEKCVSEVNPDNLSLILSLTCSALRLNPMILERIIFKLTAQFILVHKTEKDWMQYVEYLLLIIDVFKKLGRSEKLVSYLIKSLRGQLETKGLGGSLKRKSICSGLESKKKLKTDESLAAEQQPSVEARNDRLLNSIIQTYKNPTRAVATKDKKWQYIYMAWPADSVGKYFTEFVSTLMSKPSLVLWKTLTFALDDSIKSYRKESADEKNIFLIEFSSALLSQYLEGSRLPEQAENLSNEIKEARKSLHDVLGDFGKMILEFEHNNRIMNAFLEVCLCVGTFDLIAVYYSLESCVVDIPCLHSYISEDQWISLEQRIVNFGNSNAKYKIKLLHLQRVKLKLSAKNKATVADLKRCCSQYLPNDCKALKCMVNSPTNFWLMEQLSLDEKDKIVRSVITDSSEKINLKTICHLLEDSQFFELTVLRVYETMKSCFQSKKSIVSKISRDTKTEDVRDLLLSKSEDYIIKHCDVERLAQIITVVIETLPIGYCSYSVKRKLFAFSLALHRDIVATRCERLETLCFNLISSLLHFGHSLDIFAVFDIQTLMKIFPPVRHVKIYELLFTYPSIWNATTESNLSDLYAVFDARKHELTDNQIALAATFLQFIHQCPKKGVKEIMGKFIEVLGECITFYFANLSGKDEEKDKLFIKSTAIVMQLYPNHELVKNKQLEEVCDDTKRIYRKYIVSLQDHDAYSKFIGGAIQYRKQLGFDANDVDLILEEMWKKLLNDLKRGEFDENNIQKILKQVACNQTPQQLIQMFSRFEEKLSSDLACKIAIYLTKCQLSGQMVTVLNLCCHKMLSNKISLLERNSDGCFSDCDLVLSILDLLEAICLAKKHSVGVSFVDDILTFLLGIRIKNYSAEDGEYVREIFFDVYKRMIRVCSELIHCQSSVVLTRIPQFVYVFQELIHALLSYRSNRQAFTELDVNEIEKLATMGHDLENLMHAMSKYSQEMKRVAPYLLIFIMNATIVNNKSTIRYPKIKLHVENICYELIPLCDHRVGGFVLRISNDATRQIYENLCKDYDKYRKFKGKM